MASAVDSDEDQGGPTRLAGGVVRVLSIVLDVARIGLLVAAAVLAIAAVVGLIGAAQGGSASLPFLEIRSAAPWTTTALGLLVTAGWIAAAFVLVDRLRAIVRTVAAGDPFIPVNAEHLRVIWIALAIYEGGRTALGLGVGAQIAGGSSDLQPLMTELQFNPTVWLAVLALMVLARVFKEGARLRDEQQLTI